MDDTQFDKELYNALNEKVEAATEELGKIKSKQGTIKDNKKEVNEHLLNAFNEAKIPLDERQEKVVKGAFNKVIKCLTEKDKEDEDGNFKPGFITKKVEEIATLIYALKYLGIKDLEQAFGKYGITFTTQEPEKVLPYFGNPMIKETIIELMGASINLTDATLQLKDNIEEGIYKELPATLRYEKDSNPSGINKATFKKFSILNLLKKMAPKRAQQKCEKLEQETDAKTRAGLFALNYILSFIGKDK